jgi:hypothetical protein
MPDFAVEISKLLPVKDIYEDTAQPAARQAGAIGGDLMKTLHLVLAPIQLVAAFQDRFRNFIDRSVRKVPEDRRIQPAPQIVGPVLEGIRYEPEGTPIDEMFANLLANAMDQQNHGKAHPAYPNLIKQLAADEAILLSIIAGSKYTRTTEHDLADSVGPHGNTVQIWTNYRILSDTFPVERLFLPERLNFYVNHLHSLGLAGLCDDEAAHEYLREAPTEPTKQTGLRTTASYRLTDFGVDFVTACQPPV